MIKPLLFTALMLNLWACANTENPTGAINPDESERSAAPDFTMETLDHGTFKLSEATGRVVHLFFIGYACPPCMVTAPGIEKDIHLSLSSDSLTVIGIDVWDGSAGQLANFKIQTGVTFPLGLQGSGVGDLYGATNDYNILIDKKGRIAYRQSGTQVDALREKITSLIKE